MRPNWKAECHIVSLWKKCTQDPNTKPGRVRTHHADELGQRHHQLHSNQLGAISRRTDQFVVVGWVEEMLHQALLRVCPEASCNENTLSSPSSASMVRRNTLKPCASLSAFVWKGVYWTQCDHTSPYNSICAWPLPSLLAPTAGYPCVLWMQSLLNHGITHHCRLEHVSTARYTLLTRSDIIRMSQPVWMSLSLPVLSLPLSSCLCSVSIHSPLLCCTSPQLPVFCSFRLFSLHLSLSLSPPVRHPSICSRL